MNDTATFNDTIVVEIDIDAPPERVFQAWIDPQQRLAWWGDDTTYRTDRFESDLRVGGKWFTRRQKGSEGKEFHRLGRIHARRPAQDAGLYLEQHLGRCRRARNARADRAHPHVLRHAR